MNYDKKLQEIIKNLEYRPKLLLHSCCGPCSSYVIDYLINYFDITIYYYNPNIEPVNEYLKRKEEQIRFISEYKTKWALNYIDADYENKIFKKITKGLENEVEGGSRCGLCFKLRLEKTLMKALQLNYDYFGTTLTVSPYKNSKIINLIGKNLESLSGLKYLYSDFKKNNGYKKSIEMSEKYNLYRQEYCGCLASIPLRDKV